MMTLTADDLRAAAVIAVPAAIVTAAVEQKAAEADERSSPGSTSRLGLRCRRARDRPERHVRHEMKLVTGKPWSGVATSLAKPAPPEATRARRTRSR
jgi:hypothetical protein